MPFWDNIVHNYFKVYLIITILGVNPNYGTHININHFKIFCNKTIIIIAIDTETIVNPKIAHAK